MTRAVWDAVGERFYKTGVDRGMLYRVVSGAYPAGVPWNGLSAVNEAPTGGEPTPIYADNKKYLNLMSIEEFGGTIEAYTYPDEFAACDGLASPEAGVFVTAQTRSPFGFSWRTKIGNDVDGNDHGYEIHVVYGAQATPSDKSNSTINDSPEAATLSWDFSTTPVPVTDAADTAHLIFDSRSLTANGLAALEDSLYGSDASDAELLLPDALIALATTA